MGNVEAISVSENRTSYDDSTESDSDVSLNDSTQKNDLGKLSEKVEVENNNYNNNNNNDNVEEKIDKEALPKLLIDGVDIDKLLKLAEEFANPVDDKTISKPVSVEKVPRKNRAVEVTKLRNREQPKRVQSDVSNEVDNSKPESETETETEPETDSCEGKYIFMHRIPRKFNVDLIRDCRTLAPWHDMCYFTTNMGLGPPLPNNERVFSHSGWYETNQFMLEMIFHNRMKQYKCLTADSSQASAIYVPYYAGLDVARYLWDKNPHLKDQYSMELARWLRQKPEWKRMGGRDHFTVAGRITWDFRRSARSVSGWGNRLLFLREVLNMTVLVIESNPWRNNDIAIPYPTYFHPSSDREVFEWQDRMRKMRRNFFFSFAGGARNSNSSGSTRNAVINQCLESSTKCKLMDCESRMCYKPYYVMKLFQNSVFCLQPPGDSFTRRSAFDSILAGCIPVFFHPASAYVQYIWHLPKDYEKYSVLIPSNKVREGKVSIERILSRIPAYKVKAMRDEVINLIPKVIYADPRSRLETLEDAFDISVKSLLKRVETTRTEMRQDKPLTVELPEELSWKYNFVGSAEEHEWDHFFNTDVL
ncbi:hypothetical protein ACFE04_014514 [Oxalis oulophora]